MRKCPGSILNAGRPEALTLSCVGVARVRPRLSASRDAAALPSPNCSMALAVWLERRVVSGVGVVSLFHPTMKRKQQRLHLQLDLMTYYRSRTKVVPVLELHVRYSTVICMVSWTAVYTDRCRYHTASFHKYIYTVPGMRNELITDHSYHESIYKHKFQILNGKTLLASRFKRAELIH